MLIPPISIQHHRVYFSFTLFLSLLYDTEKQLSLFFSLFLIYLFIWSSSHYVGCSFLWIEPFSSYLSSDTQHQAIHLNQCLPCFAPYDGFRTEFIRKGKGRRRGKEKKKSPFCLFISVCLLSVHQSDPPLQLDSQGQRSLAGYIVHRVTNSQTPLSDWADTYTNKTADSNSVTWHSPVSSTRALCCCFLEHISKWPFLKGVLFEMMNVLKNVLPIGLK